MYRHSLQAWYVADIPHKSFHLISPFHEKHVTLEIVFWSSFFETYIHIFLKPDEEYNTILIVRPESELQ